MRKTTTGRCTGKVMAWVLAVVAALLALTSPAQAASGQISAGGGHTLNIGNDGKLYAWGSNSDGQLGDGSTTQRNTPVQVILPAGVMARAVAAGEAHSLAVGSDGKLYAWGSNYYGVLGDGSTTQRNTPVQVSLPAGVTATAAAAGVRHSLAIGSDGKLYAWGSNYDGVLGDGSTTQRNTPVQVSLPAGVTAAAVAAGGSWTWSPRTSHSLAVGSDGKVYAWGSNYDGQLGDGSTMQRNTPVQVRLPPGVMATSVAAGSAHSLAMGSDGKLYAWGSASFGQLGAGGTGGGRTPVQVSLPVGVTATAFTAGPEHSLAAGSDGKLYAWGFNYLGQLGDGSTTNRNTPVQVSLPPGVTATAVAAGAGVSRAMGSDGKLYAWGYPLLGDGGTLYRLTPVQVSLPAKVTATAVAAGGVHSLAMGSDGKLYAWGSNRGGELGDGSTTQRNMPVQVRLPPDVTATAIAAGGQGEHSLAVGNDGKLYAWGSNYDGVLGDGSTTQRNTPVQVSLPFGVTATAVSAGELHSLAVGSDSKIYAWGMNGFGQLGNNSTMDRYTPVRVSLPLGVTATAVSAGGAHNLAMGSDGKLYAWGLNNYGQVGDGSTTQRDTPVQVNLPFGVTATAVVAGGSHSLAVGSDGKLYAWGSNGSGELGDGSWIHRNTPVQVRLPPGVTATATAAGGHHSLATGSDGKFYAWGFNYEGQLGDGSTTDRNTPVQVSLPVGVTATAMAAAVRHSLAMGSDGKLYAWGHNAAGQLGNGEGAQAVPVSSDGYDNDAFAHRREVVRNLFLNTETANNSRASAEAGEPAHPGLAAQRSMWWQWTAPASGTFTVDTLGSAVDARLAVYTGNALVALTLVASDDNSAGGGQARVQFAVSAGTVHQIAVDSITGGDLQLNWWLPSAPRTAQSLSFGPLVDKLLGEAAFTVTASASSGLPVTLQSLSPAVCAVSGNLVSLVTAGACTLKASQPGDINFLPATPVTQSFNVLARLAQTITFASLPNRALSSGPFSLSATASSGLAVGFSSLNSAVCTVSGSTVSLLSVGTCAIQASQTGDGSYLPAAAISQGFNVQGQGRQAQTITFASLPDKTLGAAAFSISATASSGLLVSISSLSTAVCTVASNTLTLLSAGSCALVADQSGDVNYLPAPTVALGFAVLGGGGGTGGSGAAENGDVPLPPWATVALAGLLMVGAAWQRRRRA